MSLAAPLFSFLKNICYFNALGALTCALALRMIRNTCNMVNIPILTDVCEFFLLLWAALLSVFIEVGTPITVKVCGREEPPTEIFSED